MPFTYYNKTAPRNNPLGRKPPGPRNPVANDFQTYDNNPPGYVPNHNKPPKDVTVFKFLRLMLPAYGVMLLRMDSKRVHAYPLTRKNQAMHKGRASLRYYKF